MAIGQGSTQTAINDAVTGNKAGVVGDRLKTDVQISSISGAVTASFSSKTRLEVITSSVNLASGSYTTYYTYSGSGYLIGYSSEFNNSSIIIRMQVDGETIYAGNTISTLGGFLVTNNSTDRRQAGNGLVITGANIDWSLKQPIKFNSSITLSADANGGVLFSRQLSQALIYIVKET